MNAEYAFPETVVQSFGRARPSRRLASAAIYCVFAALVFLVQGPQPLFGPDHVSYLTLADSIRSARPAGDYWRELSSVRTQGVLLAYLFDFTHDHVQSLKLLLALVTVPYLLCLEALMRCFTKSEHNAMLFTLIGGFAVSFGVASWGITDSTAMLNRTLVMPPVFLILRLHLLHFESPWRYATYVMLVPAALLHLSAYHVLGVLLAVDAWDFFRHARYRSPRMMIWMALSLALAGAIQVELERLDISAKLTQFVFASLFPGGFAVGPSKSSRNDVSFDTSIPLPTLSGESPSASMERSARSSTAGSGRTNGVTLSPAWRAELELRPWRNMPLPLANWANIFSSYVVILGLAVSGIALRSRMGFSEMDRKLLAIFVAVPLVAFGPQTILWLLRSRLSVPQVNLEEIRIVSLVMVPSLYFTLRLFESLRNGRDGAARRTGVVALFLVLPLTMKSLPTSAREAILAGAQHAGLVDARNPSAIQNARYALGIAYDLPYYFSTIGARRWLMDHPRAFHLLLTDRDEFVLLKRPVVGPRQVVVAPETGLTQAQTDNLTRAFFSSRIALQQRDLGALERIARAVGADMMVIPWHVDGAVYSDQYYSLVEVKRTPEGPTGIKP